MAWGTVAEGWDIERTDGLSDNLMFLFYWGSTPRDLLIPRPPVLFKAYLLRLAISILLQIWSDIINPLGGLLLVY